jgi:hypothetical protein
MFGMSLFLGILIPLRRGIPIPLKNERNSYSNGNRLDFSKKHNYFLFSFSFFFFKKKKKRWKIETPTSLIVAGRPHKWLQGWSHHPRGDLGVAQATPGDHSGGGKQIPHQHIKAIKRSFFNTSIYLPYT